MSERLAYDAFSLIREGETKVRTKFKRAERISASKRTDGHFIELPSVVQAKFSDGQLNHRHCDLLDRWLKPLIREQLKRECIELDAILVKPPEQF